MTTKNEPILNLPPATRTLCLANIAIFAAGLLLPAELHARMIETLAFVPERYTSHHLLTASAFFSPVTHMFLHGGWLHLGINIGMLMAFGAPTENNLGAKRLFVIYFLSGIFGAFTHAALYLSSSDPMVGASGAISGLFGAAVMMMYNHGMIGRGRARLWPFIAVWIGISVIFGFFGMPGEENPVAWAAHIGGFASGLFLYSLMQQSK